MRILSLIVIAQFCCTSVWFAGNAVMTDLVAHFGFSEDSIGHLTSAVQLGFILGTLCFALLAVADRFSPSRVFLIAAVVAALSNASGIWNGHGLTSLLLTRLITGFALAGIYPVGMKIAADHFAGHLGRALGWLVGALVLGTAFPHLVRALGGQLDWSFVLLFTSALALTGGLLIGLGVPDGPHRKPGGRPDLTACFRVFRYPELRKAAIGYFGHMWELYTFWAFLPLLLVSYAQEKTIDYNISLLSFLIIAAGGIACVTGGLMAERFGTKSIALATLSTSGICCLLCPLIFLYAPSPLWLFFLLIWGMVVVADSPLFSTLVAGAAPAEIKATALTIVNCLGFSLTIVSIQTVIWLAGDFELWWVMPVLGVGPLVGVIGNWRSRVQ
ncbi:MFS transporter [Lewinellaceae bacterium SD302]|nr:MFS transporter [Lewinellaceae bacterium SD302]